MLLIFYNESNYVQWITYTGNADKFLKSPARVGKYMNQQKIVLDLGRDTPFNLSISRERGLVTRIKRVMKLNAYKRSLTVEALKLYIRYKLLVDTQAGEKFVKLGYDLCESIPTKRRGGIIHTSSGYMINERRVRGVLGESENLDRIFSYVDEHGLEGSTIIYRENGSKFIELGLFFRALKVESLDYDRCVNSVLSLLREYLT